MAAGTAAQGLAGKPVTNPVDVAFHLADEKTLSTRALLLACGVDSLSDFTEAIIAGGSISTTQSRAFARALLSCANSNHSINIV